jgi:hypothetical protein
MPFGRRDLCADCPVTGRLTAMAGARHSRAFNRFQTIEGQPMGNNKRTQPFIPAFALAILVLVTLLLVACGQQPPPPTYVFQIPTLPPLNERVPPSVEAFGGTVIQTLDISVEVAGNCAPAIQPSFPALEDYLTASGITIVDGAVGTPAHLAIQLQCSAYAPRYAPDMGLPYAPGLPTPVLTTACYTGWSLDGEMRLIAPGHPPVVRRLCVYQSPPERIESCGDAHSPERAAGIGFANYQVQMQLLQYLGQIWGSEIYTNYLLDRLAPASTGSGDSTYDSEAYIGLVDLGPDAREAIPILIQIMGDEHLPVHKRSPVWTTLYNLTSQSFGFGTYDVEEWQQWWDTNPTFTGQPTPTPVAPDGQCGR